MGRLKGSSVSWKSNNCLCILTLSVASIRATEDIYLPVSGCVEEGKRKALREKQKLMGISGKPAVLKPEQGRQLVWQRVWDCPPAAAQGVWERKPKRVNRDNTVRHPRGETLSTAKEH